MTSLVLTLAIIAGTVAVLVVVWWCWTEDEE